MPDYPFHEGELAVQARAGELETARMNGVMIRNIIPMGAIPFLRLQRMAVFGVPDRQGRLWAFLVFGEPGFLDAAEDRRSAHVSLGENEPMMDRLADGGRLGMLVIDLATRRRLRMNGRAALLNARELRLQIEEAYANCPKYIQRRRVRGAVADPAAAENFRRQGDSLDARAIALIRAADTFFVASAHPSGGVDVSHRGGSSGFVTVVEENRLRIPDYPGNGMFNTLGNLEVNPRVGLTFPDFRNGLILRTTGTAKILWREGQDDPADETGGTGRYWEYQVESWVETRVPRGLAFDFVDYSPFNPSPATEFESA